MNGMPEEARLIVEVGAGGTLLDLPSPWFPVVIDREAEIVLLARRLTLEGDVRNLYIAELFDMVGKGTQEPRHVALARPAWVG